MDDPRDTAGATEAARLEGLDAGRECLAAALDYLRLGLSPTCCCPPDHVGVGGWHKCDSPGKAPLHKWRELQDKAASEREVREWFRRHPNANVGVALGPVSGLVGIDVDDEEGERHLEEMSAGDLPDTWEFSSGKGRRLLYKIPAGAVLPTTHQDRGEKRPLSLLARGSQTVMPPSRHPRGVRYVWVEGFSPGDLDPAPAPRWLLDALRPDGRANGKSSGPATAIEGDIPEHSRNLTLTSLSGTMRRRGMSEAAIAAALLAENAARCKPPLSEDEVRKIAASVCRYAPDPMAGVRLSFGPKPDAAPPPPPGAAASDEGQSPPARPTVLLTPDEHVVVAEVTSALARDDELFQRGGVLVRPVTIEQEAQPRLSVLGRSLRPVRPAGLVVLRPAEPAHVRIRISANVQLVEDRKGAVRPAHAPAWLPAEVQACPGPVRAVEGILPGPTLDGDGRLIDRPGYDAATRWYLGRALPGLSLPERPGREEALAAAAVLRDLVQDFPWQHDSDLSRWLCLLLTACCRHLIDRTPLGLLTANTAGSGKTYLARLISIVAHGLAMPILMSWPEGTEFMARGDEIRKRLASLLQESAALVLIDNLPRGEDFGGPEIDGFLTADAYHDRQLGRNDGARVGGPNRCLLLATGNRVAPCGDTADRTLVVRLLTSDPNPRARPPETYHIPDLERHALAERPRYLGACLTIWRAWILAGCPQSPGPHWGTFEAWVGSVVAMVRWLGWEDPLENRLAQMAESDREAQALGALLGLWCNVLGDQPVSAGEIIRRLDGEHPRPEVLSVREALSQLGAGSRWPATPQRLGKTLAAFRARVVEVEEAGGANRLQLDGEEDRRMKGWRWFVRRLAGSAGSAGMEPVSPRAGAHARTRTHAQARANRTPDDTRTTRTTRNGVGEERDVIDDEGIAPDLSGPWDEEKF
jgi:hypothetical protein